jgi:pre-mRNA-processing factor 39
VKPLEQCQLNNWKEYLDFEIKEGKQERISLLFERCLIACALYEEFWIKVCANLYCLNDFAVQMLTTLVMLSFGSSSPIIYNLYPK